MGTDPNNIYVDLAIADQPGPVDSNGAPLCGDTSVAEGEAPVGTEGYPLSFEQMRTYVQYRLMENISGTVRAFYIKGEIDTTADPADYVDYGSGPANTGIFNMRYPIGVDATTQESLGYTVNFINWVEGESYKMKLSVKTTRRVTNAFDVNASLYFINSMDVKINIINLDLQTGTFQDSLTNDLIGNIICVNESSKDGDWLGYGYVNNKIELFNCRWYTDGRGIFTGPRIGIGSNSFVFANYGYVKTYNCIFYSTQDSDFVILDYHLTSYGNLAENSLKYYLTNTIFLNIPEMIRMRNEYSFAEEDNRIDVFDIVVKGCVFSGPFSGYVDTLTLSQDLRNLFLGAQITVQTDNQFDFPVPALTWDITTLTDADYYYLSAGWILITVEPKRTVWDQYEYGDRDGVGALYFPPMGSIGISILPSSIVDIGDTVTMANNVVDYYTDYYPSLYTWTINSEITDIDPFSNNDGTIYYIVSDQGVIPVNLKATSYNGWNSVDASSELRSLVDLATVTIDVDTYDSEGTAKTEFSIFESITTSVTNTTNTPTASISSVETSVEGTSYLLDIPNYLDNASFMSSYSSVGQKEMKFTILTTDGRYVYYTQIITIVDTPLDTFYVDLSKEYFDAKGSVLNYRIYDDFQDGSIDNAFNVSFRTLYSVVDIFGDFAAHGVVPATILNGIQRDTFTVEWAWVRSEASDIPNMYLKSTNGTLDVSVDWDYFRDVINIYNGDDKTTVNYGSYNKDMSCDNALHTMYFLFSYKNNELKLYYKTTGDTWIATSLNIAIENSVTNISVGTEGTENSGIGYIDIQADSIDETLSAIPSNGSEALPYTYEEMYDRIRVGGTGGENETYMCRNSRTVSDTEFKIARAKSYSINVWDPHAYGPWVLVFTSMSSSIDFGGSVLSNGIIYNIISAREQDLIITTLFDMFVTWNGAAKIGILRYVGRYFKEDTRADIIGCTIKSNNGFYTLKE